ncbi:MAG: hypothetical protein EAZ18_04005 [Oscillatoriales cyanobacterium]|nr:MAG: hypothetical protein EAZ18_04005 [Oscillatoriales cyanobacterium]
MPKLDFGSRGSQKPGFFPKSRLDAKIIAETRFLGLGAWESETGFLPKISVRCQNNRRNPVSWTRRVEPQKPGFLDNEDSTGFQLPDKISSSASFNVGY